jgi:ribosomal protein S18 acetylase RimI-like enzyme
MIRIARLGPELPSDQLDALEQLLRRARRELARANERFPGASERLLEASVDPAVVLLGGFDGDRLIAFLELRLHAPAPGAITIAVITVAGGSRLRGTGRALLDAAVALAKAEGLDGALVAGVHADNGGAIAFFEAAGLVRTKKSAGVVELEVPLSGWAARPRAP